MHLTRMALAISMLVLCDLASRECGEQDGGVAIRELKSWQEKIVSIRVQSQAITLAEENTLEREAGVKIGKREQDWVWEDSGRFLVQSVVYNDGRLIGREWRSANLKHYFDAGFVQNPASDIPSSVHIYENSLATTKMSGHTLPLVALWDDLTRTWLADRLVASGDATQAKLHQNGLLEIQGTSVGLADWTIFLDPQHSYLPSLATTSVPDGFSGQYTVDEFKEVVPGFWFPWKGTYTNHSDTEVYDMKQTWEMNHVDLNPELPDSLFKPPLGEETYIVDSITGKQHWHAGKPPARLVAEAKAAAQRAEMPSTNRQSVSASPESPANWSIWLVGLGILFVSAGVWVSRRA